MIRHPDTCTCACCNDIRLPESAGEDSSPAACSVPRDLLESLLENLYDLKGEREWWKDEPRCGYQRDYQRYVEEIAATEKILGQNAKHETRDE